MPAKKIKDWTKEDVIKAIHSLQKRVKSLEGIIIIAKLKEEKKDVTEKGEQPPGEESKKQDSWKDW